MTSARDVMTPQAHCIADSETLQQAAQKMRDLDVGSLPIADDSGRLIGMLTDRDIVVRGLAEGNDPTTTRAGELAMGTPLTVGPDTPAEDALSLMQQNQIRRVPVLDGDQMIGMISSADIAAALSAEQVGKTVEAVTEGARNRD